VGAGGSRTSAGAVRRGRPGHARRRRAGVPVARHRLGWGDGRPWAARGGRTPRARRRPAGGDLPRPRRGVVPGHRADRRLGPVRVPVPGVCRTSAAAAQEAAGSSPGAVAAAATGGAVAGGRRRIPELPDRARSGPRVRERRVRRAGTGGGAARRPISRDRHCRGGDRAALAVRVLTHVRLRRPVPVRGRLAAGGEAGRGARVGPLAVGRTARHDRGSGAVGSARPGGADPDGGGVAASRPAAPGPRCRRPDRRPALGGTAGQRPDRAASDLAREHRVVACRTGGIAPGDPGTDRRARALGGGRGRRSPARRARSVAAPRGAGRFPHADTGPPG